jgi:F0F1-type ATP synthase membrane subunit b/b'
LVKARSRESLDSALALTVCALAAIGIIVILLIVFGYIVWKPLI